MTGAICSSGAHIRDRSTEERDERYSPIIETLSVVSSLIRRFRPQSVQAVVSAKSTNNQLMGEKEGRKIWLFDVEIRKLEPKIV